MPRASWWSDADTLARFAGDLIAGELAQIRPGYAPPARPWPFSLRLDEDGLGVDSLDRLKLATALSEALHFAESGVADSLLTDVTFGAWIETAARSLDRFAQRLTFKTSGSTGAPKWCTHELADLEAEIDVLAARFADCRRIVSAVPSHHIYGFLFTVLLPARLDAGVFDARGSAPNGLGGVLRSGDLVVGHPAFWSAFVRGTPLVAPDVNAVTSTAPCPPEVARAVRATGVARLSEVYGSSETAGIGLRDDPDAAYELFAYWRRGNDASELVRTGPTGDERRVRVPDRLEWTADRHVRPAGRAHGAVQVGGQNVFPQRVSAVLREHPDVADAAVRLMQPHEGDRLKAFIVPREGVDAAVLRAALWPWIDAHLTVPERPRALAFGLGVPTGALGKSADWPAVGDDAPP